MSVPQKFGVLPVRRSDKVCIFVDGSNTWAAVKSLGWFGIDWQSVRTWVSARYNLIHCMYYTAVLEDELANRIQPMLDYLSYNGYIVVSKLAKEYNDELTGKKKIKGNVDIELCVDAIDASLFCDDVFLFTGDGDFCALVERMQRNGTRVHIVSTKQSAQPMVADELRRKCNFFHDLADLRAEFERKES